MATATTKLSIFDRAKAEAGVIVLKVAEDFPKEATVALAVIKIVTPLAVTVFAAADPAAAPLVLPIATEVQVGITALSVAVQDAGLHPTVGSIVAGLVSQLSTLEAVAGIKDATTKSLIGSIATELQNIANAFAPAPPTPPATEGTTNPAPALKSNG